MSFDYAALERRIAALEAALPASLRFGRVTSVSGGKARVQFTDGQNVVSYELSTIQPRVLKDQDIKMPDVGEPVACLFSGQGHEQGVILGAYYNAREAAPDVPAGQDFHRYADGTELWYDREAHKLMGVIRGDAELELEGGLTARAKKAISLESDVKITIRAPLIERDGLLVSADVDGGPGSAEVRGDVSVLEGGVSVPDKDVSAGAVSLRGHRHENSGGSGTGGTPVGGAS